MTSQLHWTAGLHHDGSALYVSNPLPALGDVVTITLRAPKDAPIERAFLYSTPDGEGHMEAMTRTSEDATSAYWTAELPVIMPKNPYSFKLLTDEGAYYLNALGVERAQSPNFYDFKLLADYQAPVWVNDRVFYQIFPDRFYNGDPSNNVEPGAWSETGRSVQFREWGELPLTWQKGSSLDFYGGDLPGIQQKIDYLLDLGVNALYLTPIFTSTSNHRYNINDFFNVDPYLGGNAALVALRQALHENDIRLILDVTPNHTGSRNAWFTEAQQDEDAPSADFYTFYKRPDEYLAWLGVSTLPKLNYASQKLREAMYRRADSVLRMWVRPPYSVDGWRLDVYNMTARQSSIQLLGEVGRELREAVKQDNPQAYIFGEHFFDGTPHLQGDEMDAVMNYQGFNLPMWRWLAGFDAGTDWRPEIADNTLLDTGVFIGQLQRYYAAVPWVIARQQFHQLCSHDTTRILNIVNGDVALVRLGAAMLMTYLGVPCVYYGDEIEMPGGSDPDNRRTMPWDESAWNGDLRDFYKRLIHLRKTAPALIEGGLQHLYGQGGLWAFQRHSAAQQLVIVGYRGPDVLESVSIPVWGAGIADGAVLVDLLGDGSYTVRDGAITLTGLNKGDALILEVQASSADK